MNDHGASPPRTSCADALRRPAAFLAALTWFLATGCGSRSTSAPGVPQPAPEGPTEHAAAPTDSRRWSERTRALYYGIPVTVRFTPADPGLEERVWKYLGQVDDLFNDYRDDSEVGRLNLALDQWARDAGPGAPGEAHAAVREFEVSEPFAEALRAAREYHRLTHGAFDVSVGRLRRLWKEAAKTGTLPTADEIAAARDACGLNGVSLDGRKLRVATPGLQFDFGGYIKGLAVDRAVEMLRRGGATAWLVQVGGETACFGQSPRGRPHVLGVQHPLLMDELWTTLADPGSGLCASSSGNYRAPIEIGGQVFYHIYDPRTGRPIDTNVLAVNVVFTGQGRNGMADALTKAGAILPRGEFLALMKQVDGQASVLVREADAIREHRTDGWDRLKARDP
jgi:thiamine biosynthesis lipoprotein